MYRSVVVRGQRIDPGNAMSRPNTLEVICGLVLGTVLFIGVCIAFQGLTYTPKNAQTDKPYFVYQGY